MTKAKKTLLIVDDDEASAYAFAQRLRSEGYMTITVEGSIAALEKIEDQSIDLAIVDVMLQKGEPHGIALARMLRYRMRNLPILFVTAYPDVVEEEGRVDHPILIKPVDLDDLVKSVRDLLAG
jgi:CheY-like chemotaxis protein